APTTAIGNPEALTGPAPVSGGAGTAGPGGFPGLPGGGLVAGERYRGQEGAPEDARVFSALGSIGVNGLVMQDIRANPIDYRVERCRARLEKIWAWHESTNPDLGTFRARGGKMILAIGTDDTLASSGGRMNYYQSNSDTMGRGAVDSFARLYVL